MSSAKDATPFKLQPLIKSFVKRLVFPDSSDYNLVTVY